MSFPLIVIPTGIDYRYERTHHGTHALLALLFGAFVLTRSDIPMALALDPQAFDFLQLLTSGFLHGDPEHLVGNMIFLAIYGPYVEERLGSWKFIGVYAACEFAANATYLAVGPLNPTIGASGAISGLLGFVVVAAPFAEVRLIIMHRFEWTRTTCISLFMVGIWLVGQILLFISQTRILGYAIGGTAVSAHLGGCFAGMGLAALMRSEHAKGTRWHLRSHEQEEGEKNVARLRRARMWSRNKAATPPRSLEHRVVLVGLRPTAQKASLTKLVVRRVQCSVDLAIERITNLERGAPQVFYLANAMSKQAFAREAAQLGAYLDDNQARRAQRSEPQSAHSR